MSKILPTLEQLLTMFDYDQEKGVLIWKNHWDKTVMSKFFGKIAGREKNSKGYSEIKINWKLHKVHRLIWFIENGTWPEQIDHINGIRNDNRIQNLRASNNRLNQHNTEKQRNGKLIGCTWAKDKNRWKAQIKLNGKTKFLGYFNTEISAHNCYMAAFKELINGPTN